MKKKSTSIKVFALVIVLLSTAVFASGSSQIQATLSPHVRVELDGVEQVMFDVNGNVVYPIVYNGTTYLPVRAISGMLDLPIEWVAVTNTVKISKPDWPPIIVGPVVSLFDAGQLNYARTNWTRIRGEENIPQKLDRNDNPTSSYKDAIAHRDKTSGSRIGFNVSFNDSYRVLSFTMYNGNSDMALYTVVGTDGIELYRAVVQVGAFVETGAIDISGHQFITITASTYEKLAGEDGMWIINPEVR